MSPGCVYATNMLNKPQNKPIDVPKPGPIKHPANATAKGIVVIEGNPGKIRM